MKNAHTIPGVTGPSLSKLESKADSTTKAARALFDAEAAERVAKTARLRQARLEREAAEEQEKKPAAVKKKAPKAKA